MRKTDTWNTYSKAQLEELEAVAAGYRAFLNEGKTERECVREIVRLAEEEGYLDLKQILAEGRQLKAGDKVYAVCMRKMVALFQIGTRPLEQGMRILGAHIDSPRLDVKQNPLYEEGGMAYLDTHYYGGIKKYQWVTVPLSLHGVVVKKDGSTAEIRVGEDADDPVLFVSDLLVHLSREQLEKKARVVIEGEGLDVVIGSRPMPPDEEDGEDSDGTKERTAKNEVKANILRILQEKYGIEEDDFISAEIEVVPAGKARDCGLDRSMILSYGQDDRVCAYTSLAAQLGTGMQEKTCCCILVDKEEIGSVGATGMHSRFFENTVAELMACTGQYSELGLRRCLAGSRMLSSDVSPAFDPMFAGSFEKKNSAFLGKGIVMNKFTGSGGKSRCNDANAEYVARIRAVFERNGVAYQTAELGKVDAGGGGTISYIAAGYGMEVVDCGVALLNMHAPMEATSKADVYEAVCAYKAFLREA